MKKSTSWVAYACYIFLLLLLLLFLFLHGFHVVDVASDSFTKFLLSIIVAVLLLPLVPHVKFFDIIDVRRDVKLFKEDVNARIKGFESRKK